jgi:hypothetical protein
MRPLPGPGEASRRFEGYSAFLDRRSARELHERSCPGPGRLGLRVTVRPAGREGSDGVCPAELGAGCWKADAVEGDDK